MHGCTSYAKTLSSRSDKCMYTWTPKENTKSQTTQFENNSRKHVTDIRPTYETHAIDNRSKHCAQIHDRFKNEIWLKVNTCQQFMHYGCWSREVLNNRDKIKHEKCPRLAPQKICERSILIWPVLEKLQCGFFILERPVQCGIFRLEFIQLQCPTLDSKSSAKKFTIAPPL